MEISSAHGRTVVALRQLTPNDTGLIVEMLERLSDHTRWLRYLLSPVEPAQAFARRESARLAASDPQRYTTMLAIEVEAGREHVVAIGEVAYAAPEAHLAEIALVVRDDRQQQGIGTQLAHHLSWCACMRGVRMLQADMLAENRAILRLVRKLGVSYTADTQQGETRVMAYLA